MAYLFPLKPSHKPVKAYFEALATFSKHGHTTEGNTRSAFADLLKRCCPTYGWHLVEEYQFKGTAKQSLRADGALVDDLTLVHGLWEAKDADDDLTKEITRKRNAGYPLTNILFQSPSHAVLYQDSRIIFNDAITTPEKLVEVLELFFEHKQAHEVDWEDAVTKFAAEIPNLANGVTKILEDEFRKNATFRENFASFAELCRQSINPDLTDDAIRKMLVQHLLTERIFRKVFNNQEFLQRNVIAAEIEKVIRSITARHFSRDEFLKPLDRFYTAIERAAESQQGYTEKQHFLNAVYEKFFQRFDTRQADTHGIVYTPQPIVDFMVRSVEEILQQEFGKSLSDSGVHILDPFTGTGNFITRIMQQIKRSALPHKYAEELHCNEIMLLPYYIASMNIEHAYMEKLHQYSPFEGICLVDTFELAEARQATLFTTENTARVSRQKTSPIKVVIGNPPYNVGQHEENDNNKNRPYPVVDGRIADTYGRDSLATNKTSLRDPYVKAFRWASDRIGDEGVISLVTNSKFIHGLATDGMRGHLEADFDRCYVLDLGGDVRSNPKLSGTKHNVFGIQTGVAISLLIRHKKRSDKPQVRYARFTEAESSIEKLRYISSASLTRDVQWEEVKINSRHSWVASSTQDEFTSFLPLRSDEAQHGVFELNSNGLKSNRDAWVFNFNRLELASNVEKLINFYMEHLDRRRLDRHTPIDKFVIHDDLNISWSRDLKEDVDRGTALKVDKRKIVEALYRPYTKNFVYFDRVLNEEVYSLERVFPPGVENLTLITTTDLQVSFSTQASRILSSVHVGERASQCFPFYTFSEDGSLRTENITDWSLSRFRSHYGDQTITKWDIFHATYAILHHPEYRTRYAANLKRELPRIPFPPDFHAFAQAGKRLMQLHIDYEKQPEYKLEQIESETAEVSFRVTRIILNKKDRSELKYNDFLTLRGIPLDVYNYRLGNRSALEWVIDQYRITTDPRSGITNDPNRGDDPKYILRLIGQVITVSLETQQIISSLPTLGLGSDSTNGEKISD